MPIPRLLNEYIVTTNVNDRFKFRGNHASSGTCTITAGRYRDIVALCTQMSSDMTNAGASIGADGFTWSCNTNTGIISVTSNDTFNWINFDSANYGTTLRNDLGFSTDTPTITSNTATATSGHVGGFYPSEPIENDTRPNYSSNTDNWVSDTFQTITRTGLIATKGGSNYVEDRSITFLLPQSDLANYSTWLRRCALGYSFVIYHDRTVAYPGSDSEYSEYKIYVGEENGLEYRPEQVDESNKIWHRATIDLRKRVAPTT